MHCVLVEVLIFVQCTLRRRRDVVGLVGCGLDGRLKQEWKRRWRYSAGSSTVALCLVSIATLVVAVELSRDVIAFIAFPF